MSIGTYGAGEDFFSMKGRVQTLLEMLGITAVSYTHLDVYKRQVLHQGDRQSDNDGKCHFNKRRHCGDAQKEL